jgi:hypothetical protein
LPDAIEADAVGPFPVIPASSVYNAAIWKMEEELAVMFTSWSIRSFMAL